MTLSWRRLVIPDPSLLNHFGHHYNYDKAVLEAAGRQGLQTLLLAHKSVAHHVQQSLHAVPHFQVSSYLELALEPDRAGEELDPYFVFARQIMVLNSIFFNELNRLTPYIGPDDLVFFHTVSDIQMLGATQWLLSFADDRRPHSNFVLRFWHDRPHSHANLQLCVANLVAPRMRTRLSTDTTELSALYSQILRAPVDLIPIPHTQPELAENRRRFLPELAPGTVVIGYAGDCRWSKGFGFLIPLIEAFRASSSRPFHFLIQVSVNAATPQIQSEVNQLASYPRDQVTLVTETLSTEDYHGLMHEMGIVLITYDAKATSYPSSGVFTEAASSGKVTIVPNGTAMHHEALRSGTGFRTFGHFDAASVIEAVRSAVADYPVLAERAAGAAGRLARYHNADNLIAYLRGEEVLA